MSLLQPKTIEEAILHSLVGGPQKTTDLLAGIDLRTPITKQGYYAALRKLKTEEAVVVYKSVVSLNTAWIGRMSDWIDKAHDAYLSDSTTSNILSLKEGESVSYTFMETRHLDTFWGHTQNILVNETPANEPVYSFDPHYWFYIAREETERRLVDAIIATGKQFLMTVGDSQPLDKAIKSDFSDDSRQYHMDDMFGRRNYYVVVTGNYITEVVLDPRIVEKIERIYSTHTKLNEAAISELQLLLTLRARHKIKISHNSRRARMLKTKLAKNFFIRR